MGDQRLELLKEVSATIWANPLFSECLKEDMVEALYNAYYSFPEEER